MAVSGLVRRLALGGSMVALAACGGGDGASAPEGFGTVTGRIVAADGTTPIPGAEVGLEARPDGGPVDTTDANGDYTLADVPSGRQTLLAIRGAFRAEFQVTVRADDQVTAPVAKVQPTGALAYLPGAYDAIEEIVRDSLGYPMAELDPANLGSESVINQYSMIFVNCGADVYTVMGVENGLTNLRNWVADGGILYASDWSLDLVEAMFPTILGVEITGDAQDLTATVASPALADFVGRNSVALRYDLPSWKTPSSVTDAAEILVRGSFVDYDVSHTDKALAIRIPYGSGQVIFTSFHNEAGVTADQLAVLRYFIFID